MSVSHAKFVSNMKISYKLFKFWPQERFGCLGNDLLNILKLTIVFSHTHKNRESGVDEESSFIMNHTIYDYMQISFYMSQHIVN